MNNAQRPTREVILEFMQMTGCPQVFLYGGAAIDRYLNPNCQIMDYDIAIKNPEDYAKVLDKLKELGFDVGNTRSAHNLATVAKHPMYGIYDLSCMDIKQNGIYNLEKFYIEYSAEYPLGKAVDTFGAVPGLREGRIKIANDPDQEKAYDLLRRFSVLSGKYNLSLVRGGKNEDTMATIERRLQETPNDKKNEHSRVRCLSRFIGASFRRNKQAKYFSDMGKTGLFAYGFPAINEVINNPDFIEELTVYPARDKKELIEKMHAYSRDKDAFIDEISLLSKRERDREDAKVFDKIVEYTSQKTSLNKLNRDIIQPLLQFKLSRGA